MKKRLKVKTTLEKDLTAGNEYGVILRFVLPILLGNIFQQLYNTVDSIVVGRILGRDALAAVGASYGISSIILAVAMGLTLGNSILISKSYGSRECDKIQDIIDTGVILTAVMASAIMLTGLVKAEALVGLFKVPEDIKKEVLLYFRIILLGTIPLFGYNAVTNFLRGLGDSRTPLYFLVISSVVNAGLDILFVKTFALGVAGAAIATVAAQSMAFIAIVIYINRNLRYRIKLRNLKCDLRILRESLGIGIPAMLQQVFIGFGNSVLQILINGYGTTVISAYTAASKIDGFATLPAVNIGKAMSNYVAQNLGAGEIKRVRSSNRAGFILTASVSVVMSVLVFALPDSLMGLFGSSKEVCRTGAAYLRTVSLFYIIFGSMQLLNGILIGRGKSFVSMISTIGSFCLLQVPAAILLSGRIGVAGIWIAAPIGWLGGLIMRYCYYRRIRFLP